MQRNCHNISNLRHPPGGKTFTKFVCGSYYDKPDKTLIRVDDCWEIELTALRSLLREILPTLRCSCPKTRVEVNGQVTTVVTDKCLACKTNSNPLVKAIMEEKP